MARKNLIRQNKYPYHVYTRCNNRDWFKLPLSEMWVLFLESIVYANNIIPIELHSFVLMGNHYHLLVTTPNSNLDKFMEYFNRRLSQRINKQAEVANHKFANGYKWTIVDNHNYLYSIYRYIYQNPVRKNLCRRCLDYPYSSLRLSPQNKYRIKLKPHLPYSEYAQWFELRNCEEHDGLIRKGLLKAQFRVAKGARINLQRKLCEKPTKNLPN